MTVRIGMAHPIHGDSMAKQELVTDPVCGMRIDSTRAVAHREYRGSTYYFCSAVCSAKFDGDAEHYAGAAPAGSQPGGGK